MIAKPHAKPDDKELLLATLENMATLPEDDTGGYNPHVPEEADTVPPHVPYSREKRLIPM